MKTNSKFLLLTTCAAFSNTVWKTNEEGGLELKDGNPVYIDSQGREMTVDGNTISKLHGEAREYRQQQATLTEQLKAFEGISDPKAAIEALEKMKKIGDKELIDAGKVDEVRSEITKSFENKLKASDEENASLKNRINNMIVDDVFKSSEFIRESVAVPHDMFAATFRNNFAIDDKGNVFAKDQSGQPIYSNEFSGELAKPEEALKILVDKHPKKDDILRADLGQGSGSAGAGGMNGRGRVMKRVEFDKLDPGKQAEVSKMVREGKMQLTD